MPNILINLYSIIFKYHFKQLLQTLQKQHQIKPTKTNSFGVTSRPLETTASSSPSFTDGVATKDIHVDPISSLSVRIYLPETAVNFSLHDDNNNNINTDHAYGGYLPSTSSRVQRRLPIVLEFHGGGFVSGSNESVGNDGFCRRMAKLCDVIVVAVGYRLGPESKFPGGFEDGVKVLNWLGKQASLEVCRRFGGERRNYDSFGASLVEPWLAAHGDPSRCVLLGVSSGANIANYVARKAVEAGNLFDPVKVVAQVLMYPFFIGSNPTRSEVKLANSYFYDKTLCIQAWKLFLPENEFSLDHPAANPLILRRQPPLKNMPPTLTVVAEHDFMRDRAIAYSEEMRKFNVDAPVLDYKDTVHEFATLGVFLHTPQARACAEDIAIWVNKYISLRGQEFSY